MTDRDDGAGCVFFIGLALIAVAVGYFFGAGWAFLVSGVALVLLGLLGIAAVMK